MVWPLVSCLEILQMKSEMDSFTQLFWCSLLAGDLHSACTTCRGCYLSFQAPRATSGAFHHLTLVPVEGFYRGLGGSCRWGQALHLSLLLHFHILLLFPSKRPTYLDWVELKPPICSIKPIFPHFPSFPFSKGNFSADYFHFTLKYKCFGDTHFAWW